MLRAISITFAGLIVVLGACSGLLLLAYSEPSTAALDADLAEVRDQIKIVDEEDTKYPGGAIKALVVVRREILRASEAMLRQKRASFLRRIDLKYVIDGKLVTPARDERLGEISKDIEKANASLSKHITEAERYSGGLIQVMSLMAAATDRLTIAQLNLAYYGAKYGMVPCDQNPACGIECAYGADSGTCSKGQGCVLTCKGRVFVCVPFSLRQFSSLVPSSS